MDNELLSSASEPDEYEVEGLVVEIVEVFRLAHVRGSDGLLYSVNRRSPGIEFDRLFVGCVLKLHISRVMHRVLCVSLVG